jgi:hypothetical protein
MTDPVAQAVLDLLARVQHLEAIIGDPYLARVQAEAHRAVPPKPGRRFDRYAVGGAQVFGDRVGQQ